jgi:hypothetical protein
MPMAGIVKRLHRDPARELRALVGSLLADAASIPSISMTGWAARSTARSAAASITDAHRARHLSQHREAIAEAVSGRAVRRPRGRRLLQGRAGCPT